MRLSLSTIGRLLSSARLPLTLKFSKRMTCIGAAVNLSRRVYDSLNLFVRVTAHKGVDRKTLSEKNEAQQANFGNVHQYKRKISFQIIKQIKL